VSADTAARSSEVVIRHCRGNDELRACVALQKEVWKFDDADLVPLRIFVVAGKIGGQSIGAFAGDELVGFAFSIPGMRSGHPYLHSHMLAVRETYRNTGLGRRLKLAQRAEALDRGIDLIEWTFDPLEIKNSHLNLGRLGAIARRYSVDHYGGSSSPLQGGLPTDRLVAEWWLKSKRVVGLLEHNEHPQFQVVRKIGVPAQIYQWKASDAERARAVEVQKRNREEFQVAFALGFAVLGYERDPQDNGTFLLGRWDEERWGGGPWDKDALQNPTKVTAHED
jgi:predicted GNAT superfamily acetyltransferase